MINGIQIGKVILMMSVKKIVIAEAKLIRAQIHEMDIEKNEYPRSSKFKDTSSARNWIPNLLTLMRPESVFSPVLFRLTV